jgi:hypothetical protein
MTTNLSESFNHVLKNARVMPISALVQLTFYRCNGYWVKQRCEASDVIQSGVIWPPTIQLELIMSRDRLRDYTAMLFNSEEHVFHVNTSIKLSVMKEVR